MKNTITRLTVPAAYYGRLDGKVKEIRGAILVTQQRGFGIAQVVRYQSIGTMKARFHP